MDRSVHLALAAATQAHHSAQLDSVNPERIALLVGNSRGPVGKWSEGSVSRVLPSRAANTAIASLSGALSISLVIRGPVMTISATCASAAHAVGMGAGLLLAGEADVVLAGGAEAPLVGPLLDQFHAAGLVGSHPDPRQACRPFDWRRNGMVPGEGAAFLVIETASHAERRGKTPLAILAGWATGAEAHNRVATRPDGAGLARIIRQTLRRAAVDPSQVGYINAHGTGTNLNDAAEAAAIEEVFGAGEAAPWVSSTKPITGHTFGAAPAIESVVALEALARRMAPPNWNGSEPDPGFALNLVGERPQPIDSPYVLSLSLGFWGNIAALLFRSPNGA